MKRTHIKLAAVAGALLLWGGCAFSALAQGHFVTFDQGIVASTTSYGFFDNTWVVDVGSGYSGTTTGAFTSASFTKNLSTDSNSVVVLAGFVDSNYTVSTTSCTYNSQPLATGTYSATSSRPFLQLEHYAAADSGYQPCQLQPQYFYQIIVEMVASGFGGSSAISVAGNGDWIPFNSNWTIVNQPFAPFFPYFSIVSNNFQITPTASSSGIFFSGAVDFCNNAFASTTGIGATIGNGLCIATGFLFVPTAESYSQFTTLPGVLQRTPPISWFSDLAGIYQSAQSSTTDNFINLSIDFGATTTKAVGIQKLDVISTTTISKYLPESLRQGILGLEAAVFLASAASAIYFTLKHIWKTT